MTNTRCTLVWGRLPVLSSLLAALPVMAQVVNDGASLTLSNVTNSFPGDVTVGTNGSFTLLVLSDNALLTNSANGVIGRNALQDVAVRTVTPFTSRPDPV